MTRRYKDLTGQTFGRLTVLRPRLDHDNKDRMMVWECKCQCGQTVFYRGNGLVHGGYKSCGCIKKEKSFQEMSGSYLYQIRYRAKRAGIPFTVTNDYLWKLFEKQGRKCALSDQPIAFAQKLQTASLDQINPGKGYVKGNVQWLHKWVNIMKLDHSQRDFLDLVCRIASFSCK